jgi:hypothetical protein
MGKHIKRKYVVRGFNVFEEDFNNPIGLIQDKETFHEIVVDTQAEAIIELFTNDAFSGMNPIEAKEHFGSTLADGYGDTSEYKVSKNGIHIIDIEIGLSTDDKIEVRDSKSQLEEIIKTWAEKSRVKNVRGFRFSAIKTPIFEYKKGYTSVRTQVILSNAILYNNRRANIDLRTEEHIQIDLNDLRVNLLSVFGPFTQLVASHPEINKGERFWVRPKNSLTNLSVV